MFEYNYESSQWVMMEYYMAYFQNQLNILQAMGEHADNKWSEEQYNAYVYFINSLSQYIINYIYASQVQFYEDYVAMLSYFSVNNPMGAELYQKQLDYLQYLQKKE